METGTATKTVHFELDIIGRDEDRRCYRCHNQTAPMFVVRPPRSSVGRYSCLIHVGPVADEWDLPEQR